MQFAFEPFHTPHLPSPQTPSSPLLAPSSRAPSSLLIKRSPSSAPEVAVLTRSRSQSTSLASRPLCRSETTTLANPKKSTLSSRSTISFLALSLMSLATPKLSEPHSIHEVSLPLIAVAMKNAATTVSAWGTESVNSLMPAPSCVCPLCVRAGL